MLFTEDPRLSLLRVSMKNKDSFLQADRGSLFSGILTRKKKTTKTKLNKNYLSYPKM